MQYCVCVCVVLCARVRFNQLLACAASNHAADAPNKWCDETLEEDYLLMRIKLIHKLAPLKVPLRTTDIDADCCVAANADDIAAIKLTYVRRLTSLILRATTTAAAARRVRAGLESTATDRTAR